MKLSIIIPVYNTEKYLSRCLQSIFGQNFNRSEYEVIIINDGSSDQSEHIIYQFAMLHRNLIYLRQSNQGVSAARNAGMDLAKGEYITFVDSDDEIEKNSLQLICEKLEKDNLDILYPKIATYSENGELLGNITFGEKYEEIRSGILQERRTYPPTFYRKTLIKDIRFNETISFGEDTVFNVKAQSLAERVIFVNYPYYKYTVRQNSLSKQGRSEKTFRGLLKAIIEVRRFQQLNFQKNPEAKNYFDKVYEIFVTRILELNVIPNWNRAFFDELLTLLEEEEMLYILTVLSDKYPYLDRSFGKFKAYKNYHSFKAKMYSVIYDAYRSLVQSKNNDY